MFVTIRSGDDDDDDESKLVVVILVAALMLLLLLRFDSSLWKARPFIQSFILRWTCEISREQERVKDGEMERTQHIRRQPIAVTGAFPSPPRAMPYFYGKPNEHFTGIAVSRSPQILGLSETLRNL